MAERIWEVSKVRYCDHVKREVSLEAEVLYPADFLPDPPRVLAHRCTLGQQCNLFAKPACIWAGTNPDHDPYRQ